MGGVILLMGTQLSGQVSYDLSLLHKDATKTKLGGITIYIKPFGNIRHGENRVCYQSSLELLKTSLTLVIPFKLLVLLQELGEGFGNTREILNKLAVVPR